MSSFARDQFQDELGKVIVGSEAALKYFSLQKAIHQDFPMSSSTHRYRKDPNTLLLREWNGDWESLNLFGMLGMPKYFLFKLWEIWAET